MLKAVALLVARAERRMVAHERREHAQRQKAEHQVARRVVAKAAQIRAAVEEARHVCRRQHFEVEQDMRPPRLVVAEPDAGTAVCADIGGAREHQDLSASGGLFKILTCRARHTGAVEVVHALVIDLLTVDRVVDGRIVCLRVGQSHKGVLQLKELVQI